MISKEQLEACPRFDEHGLIEGCGLCDPSRMPSPKVVIEIDAAMSATEGRHRAEQLRIANDAKLAEIQKMGYQVGVHDIISLHLAVLLDTLLGDMDDPRRQAFEIATHTKLAELLDETATQIARRKLVEGIPGVNPAQLPKRPGGRW